MKQGQTNIDENSEGYWSGIADEYFASQYKDVKGYPALKVRHNYILDLFDKKGKKVLDIGCAPVELLIDLLKRKCDVYGMDISSEMINIAKENVARSMPGANCHLSTGNIENLGFDKESFDAVISSGVIEYLKTDENALKEMHRVLKKKGTLILTVRNLYCMPRILDAVTDSIKGSKEGLSLVNKLRKVLGKKDVATFTPYRKHAAFRLDRMLDQHGFTKEDFRYFHFYPFFVPFDKLFPSAFIKLGLKMERLSHSPYGWLASGYIVK